MFLTRVSLSFSFSVTERKVLKHYLSYYFISTCPECHCDVGPESRKKEEGQAIDLVENSDKGDEEKPEPEEEVKLLVDDIVRENTDSCSRRGMASSAILGEGA